MITLPENIPVQQQEQVLAPWARFFLAVYSACFSLYQSGTTAQRPTKGLWKGRRYFDTSLGANGKPIWYVTGTTWIDGSGASV